MHLHPNKTKVMIFSPKQKIHNKHITIKYNDVELENTDNIISRYSVRFTTTVELERTYTSCTK